jgi:hypothetical protein
MITVERDEFGPSMLRFLAHQLPPAEKFSGAINPFDPSAIYIYDASGRFKGACKRIESISRDNVEEIQKQCGRIAHVEKELLKPIAARGAALLRKRIDDARSNAEVLSSAPTLNAVAPPAPQTDFAEIAEQSYNAWSK